MTEHWEQQACEANTANSQTIPLDKHIVTDPLEDILKQLEKQTHTSHIFTQNKQLKHSTWNTGVTHYTKG